MFLDENDMETAIYGYQIEEIADGNDLALPAAITAAVEEVRGYLTPNSKKIYQDGRPIYDAEAIFAAAGAERNSLLLQIVKTIAKFYFIQSCNADILYERAKSNYDRSISLLKDIAAGNITIGSLPLLNPESETDTETVTANEPLPFRMGTRKKFNHE